MLSGTLNPLLLLLFFLLLLANLYGGLTSFENWRCWVTSMLDREG